MDFTFNHLIKTLRLSQTQNSVVPGNAAHSKPCAFPDPMIPSGLILSGRVV
jgi:hypothetical protein